MSETTVTKHYRRLAHRYDRTWRAYLQGTLGSALEALQLQGTEHILDVGCGTGEFARLALERFPGLQIIGVDMTSDMIEVAKQKFAQCPSVQFQVGQADALPCCAEQFDAVVCANMLHHVRQPLAAFREFVRVLRPGGRLIMVDWCRDFWHCRVMHLWLRWADRTYVRMYRMAEMTTMLKEVGFTVRAARRFAVPPAYGIVQCIAQKIVWVPR